MTIASNNLSKIGLGVPKENKNPIPTPAHFGKRNRLQYIKKKHFGSYFCQNMQLRLSTLTPQPWLKLKQLISGLLSRLALEGTFF